MARCDRLGLFHLALWQRRWPRPSAIAAEQREPVRRDRCSRLKPWVPISIGGHMSELAHLHYRQNG